MSKRLVLLALLPFLWAAPAYAVDPDVAVGGANSKWTSGDWLSQSGTNCSILGQPYAETMISGVASYGGTSGIPTVGQGYYTSLLVSVPGNPCGSGSSGVSTDVALPPNTVIDTSRPIRCFGQTRSATTFMEITNETWAFLGYSGRYCPTAATPSTRHSGAWNIGYRPLANGQMFAAYVPVKSSQPLIGSSASPAHTFQWLTDSTGVYSNPGQSSVGAHVLASSTPTDPYLYFEPAAALPFWKADASAGPPDTRNRVEFWVNLSTAGLGGYLCFQIRNVSDNSPNGNCHEADGYNGTVAPGMSLVQVNPAGNTIGPNGGYAPFYWTEEDWNREMEITWTFTPTGRAAVSKSAKFRLLPGPDGDLDGVADVADACPSVKGTLPNGCQPAVVPDPDGDGVYGAADLCPSTDGKGALNGCPGGVVPSEPPKPTPTPTPFPTVSPTPTPTPTPTPASTVSAKWTVKASRFTLRSLSLAGLPEKWTAQIRCSGAKCPFKQRSLKGKARRGAADVLPSLKSRERSFRAGQTLDVWISSAGFNTGVVRLALKAGKIPKPQRLCAPPGQTTVRRVCP